MPFNNDTTQPDSTVFWTNVQTLLQPDPGTVFPGPDPGTVFPGPPPGSVKITRKSGCGHKDMDIQINVNTRRCMTCGYISRTEAHPDFVNTRWPKNKNHFKQAVLETQPPPEEQEEEFDEDLDPPDMVEDEFPGGEQN